jgi:hypothetical protein
MKKDQKDKFAYIYEQFPEGWKIQRSLHTIEKLMLINKNSSLNLLQVLLVSQLTSSGVCLPANHDNTNQDDYARMCHMLADNNPQIKQLLVDLRTPILTRSTGIVYANAYNNLQV